MARGLNKSGILDPKQLRERSLLKKADLDKSTELKKSGLRPPSQTRAKEVNVAPVVPTLKKNISVRSGGLATPTKVNNRRTSGMTTDQPKALFSA